VIDETSQSSVVPKNTKKKQASAKTAEATVEPGSNFEGDRTLANSIALLHDGIISREFAYATAEGDPGRVYAVMKVSSYYIYLILTPGPDIVKRSCSSRLRAQHIPNT
jgi:hypothetical protein